MRTVSIVCDRCGGEALDNPQQSVSWFSKLGDRILWEYCDKCWADFNAFMTIRVHS